MRMVMLVLSAAKRDAPWGHLSGDVLVVTAGDRDIVRKVLEYDQSSHRAQDSPPTSHPRQPQRINQFKNTVVLRSRDLGLKNFLFIRCRIFHVS